MVDMVMTMESTELVKRVSTLKPLDMVMAMDSAELRERSPRNKTVTDMVMAMDMGSSEIVQKTTLVEMKMVALKAMDMDMGMGTDVCAIYLVKISTLAEEAKKTTLS